TALGGATLGPASDRRLPVYNLGSSGQDGVEVQLNSMFGGGVSLDAYPFLNTPGASYRIKDKGWDGTIKGKIDLVSNGNGTAAATFDYSALGAHSVTFTHLAADG